MYRIRKPAFAAGIPLATAFALLIAWSVGASQPTELPTLTLTKTATNTTARTVGLDVFADSLAFPEAVRRNHVPEQRAIALEEPVPSQGTWSIAKESWGIGVVNSPQDGSFPVPASYAAMEHQSDSDYDVWGTDLRLTAPAVAPYQVSAVLVADDNTQSASGFEFWSTGVPVQAAGLVGLDVFAEPLVPEARVAGSSDFIVWHADDGPPEAPTLGTFAVGQQADDSDGSSSPNTWLIWWPPFGNAPSPPAVESYAVGHLAQGSNRMGQPATGVVAWPVWGNTPTAPALESFGGARVSVLAEGQ